MPKSLLMIISGSIAAYKSLDIIRRLREVDITISTILTKGGAEFITPLSIAALSGGEVYTDLFSWKDESDMGHIRLSRAHDMVMVIPASADIIGKMANGLCDDLATATLLASNKPVVIAPAMNSKMWEHPALQRNIAQLVKDGVQVITPASGALACGETGQGKLADVEIIVEYLLDALNTDKPLQGVSVMVTSGPTHEAIDPVRYIANRSSGKQGIAIAQSLQRAGANVTLITGATAEAIPYGITTVNVETAEEMLQACKAALPVNVAIFCAAVADWKVKEAFNNKLKKRANETAPTLTLVPNPDILSLIAHLKSKRPALVIGFAAETENLVKNATAKLKRKGCDWLIANDVSGGQVFGKEDTNVLFLTTKTKEEWKNISKLELGTRLAAKIAEVMGKAKTL